VPARSLSLGASRLPPSERWLARNADELLSPLPPLPTDDNLSRDISENVQAAVARAAGRDPLSTNYLEVISSVPTETTNTYTGRDLLDASYVEVKEIDGAERVTITELGWRSFRDTTPLVSFACDYAIHEHIGKVFLPRYAGHPNEVVADGQYRLRPLRVEGWDYFDPQHRDFFYFTTDSDVELFLDWAICRPAIENERGNLNNRDSSPFLRFYNNNGVVLGGRNGSRFIVRRANDSLATTNAHMLAPAIPARSFRPGHLHAIDFRNSYGVRLDNFLVDGGAGGYGVNHINVRNSRITNGELRNTFFAIQLGWVRDTVVADVTSKECGYFTGKQPVPQNVRAYMNGPKADFFNRALVGTAFYYEAYGPEQSSEFLLDNCAASDSFARGLTIDVKQVKDGSAAQIVVRNLQVLGVGTGAQLRQAQADSRVAGGIDNAYLDRLLGNGSYRTPIANAAVLLLDCTFAGWGDLFGLYFLGWHRDGGSVVVDRATFDMNSLPTRPEAIAWYRTANGGEQGGTSVLNSKILCDRPPQQITRLLRFRNLDAPQGVQPSPEDKVRDLEFDLELVSNRDIGPLVAVDHMDIDRGDATYFEWTLTFTHNRETYRVPDDVKTWTFADPEAS